MIKTKKQMFLIIASFVLVILLCTTTYAFFNYTRTGTSNVIKTGRISFSTSQDGTLSLTNVFPVASNSVGNDYTSDTLKIAITGDTTYSEGIEYLVTAEDVNVETSTGKKVPMTLKVGVTDDLGTQDTDNDEIEYFTDRGGNTSYYKILSESILYDGQYLLVGYIAPGQTGIDGTVNIKAYLDEDRVAISDTYPEGEVSHTEGVEPNQETIIDGYNGTTSNWVNGRVVLTTAEWNSLQTAGNELSFKVRVEANEGTWVDPATNPNAIGRIPSELTNGINEIYFIKETPIRMQRRYDAASVKADITDTTLNEGKVLGWQEGNKLYIASSGETYLPQNSGGYFAGLINVEIIEFENINTSRVTTMTAMFSSCISLESLDLSGFNASNVTNMNSMFSGCSSLEIIDINCINANSVTNMNSMFSGCSSLISVDLTNMGSNSLTGFSGVFDGCSSIKTINMSGFNFGTASLERLFYQLTNLENLDLSNVNTSNVTNLSMMFNNCTKLTSLDLSDFDTSNVVNIDNIFANMNNLKTLNLSGWSSNKISSLTYIFSDTVNLEEINMSNFNFGSSSLNSLFANLSYLKKVDLSNVNTSGVTIMTSLFNGCSSLASLDLSDFDTGEVTSLYAAFANSGLVSLNLDNWDLSSISTVNSMFSNSSNLKNISCKNWIIPETFTNWLGRNADGTQIETIDVSNWNLTNTRNIGGLFADSTNLQTIIGLNTWNTQYVEKMNDMFQGISVTELDLSSFNTSSLTNAFYMFGECSNLATIYVSNSWNMNSVSDSSSMFGLCTSLVGGAGTTYDYSHTDKTYAHIDGGPSNPGYLTLKTN